MDIGKSFSFVIEDKEWVKKVVIGGVLSLVPIANLIVTGYGLRTVKNVAAGADKPLPEWDDWGDDFVRGLMVVLATLIYSAPAIILSIIFAIASAMTGEYASGELQGTAAAVMLLFNCLAGLWGLVVGLWMPAAMANYASRGTFASMFEFERIWQLISENLGNYFTVIVVMILAAIAGSFGTILCVIGVLFTQFYAQLVGMHALGQFLKDAGVSEGPAL